MRKNFKSTLGVTLLEVMLVLAIAAMIIVMSVRYYQSANSSQQANAVISQVSAIVGQANNLAQSSGTFSAVTSTTLKPLLPGAGFSTPWGTTITVTGAASNMTITVPGTPAGVCPLLTSKLEADNHYKTEPASTACPDSAGDVTVTYTSNP